MRPLPSATPCCVHPEVAARIQKGIDDAFEAAKQAEVPLTLLSLHKDKEIEELHGALQGKHYDGIVCGGGLRGDHMTELLEHVVQHVRKHAPHSVLMFNTGPLDTLNCVKRYWPNIKYTPPPPSQHDK